MSKNKYQGKPNHYAGKQPRIETHEKQQAANDRGQRPWTQEDAKRHPGYDGKKGK